jgi:cell division septum initiation protein DivIVA
MVQDIIFHIKKHQLTVETYPKTLVANSVNYLQAVFIFDDYNQKDFCWAKPEGAEKYFIHAEFSWNGVNKWTELIIKDGIAKVNVPWEVTKAPGFSVSVFSTEYEGSYADKKIKKRITTRPVPIILNASGDINGSAGTPYSDEVNLLMLIDEAYSYSQSAYALALEAKSKVDYLEDKVEQKQVSVGGVNILSNSRNIPLYSNDSSKWPIKREPMQERNRIFERYSRINTSLNPGTLSFYNTIYYKNFTEDISGIYVTFSFLARANMDKVASLMMYVSDPEGGAERIDFSPVTETIVLSSEWKRYSYSIKLNHIFTQSAIIRFCPCDVYFSSPSESSEFFLDICEWKVERGTVATDWTPSLEETDQQITEIKTSLREEVDKIVSEVEGEVSTLEGDFKKINSQVQTLESSTSYISNEAYGANILVDSGLYTFTPERWDSRTGFEITDDGAKITSAAGMLSQSILGKLEKDTIYTASIKVKVVKPSSTGYLRILDNGVYQGSWFAIKSKDIPITSAHGWRTYHFTFTTDYRVPAATRYYYILDWQKISDTAEIYFKELKLEKGAWPTAWSDDPQANKRVYSKIEQTAESLTSEIGDFEKGVNSKIEQTAKSLTSEIEDLEKGVSKIEQTADSLTTEIADLEKGVNSKIEQTAKSLTSKFTDLEKGVNSKIEQTAKSLTSEFTDLEKGVNSKIEQTAGSLTTEIGDVEKRANSKITQLSEKINLEVNGLDDKLSSQINLIPGKITSEVSNLNSKLSSKIEQTEEDILAKITGIEEGKTDYIRFSEEGLIVGDWVGADETGSLGGNIKIASNFGVPEIQLRNNDNLYATFSPGSIQVGLDKDYKYASGIYLREGACSLVSWKEGMNAENETILSALRSDFTIYVEDNDKNAINLGILPSDDPHIYINSSSSTQETIAMDWLPYDFSMDFGSNGSINPVILKGFSMNVEFSGAGFITGSGKRVCFTIPINKAIPTFVQTVTVESNSGLKIRQNGDYIYADDNVFVTPTKYFGYITYLYSNSILIYADFDTTKSPYKKYISNLTNNSACGVQASLTLTFS